MVYINKTQSLFLYLFALIEDISLKQISLQDFLILQKYPIYR